MGKVIAFWLAVITALTLPATAQDLFPLQPHPADTDWPTQGWEIGTLDPAIEETVGNLIVEAMLGEKDDVMGQTRAVVVIHKGKLVAEAYKDDFREDTKQVSWSMAKSITQALVGRAVHLGLIDDIDAPMPTPFPEGDSRNVITWRQWMNMTDGLDYREINATTLADNDVVNMMYGRGKYDVLAYAETELPLVHAPGEVWNYSTAVYHLISGALSDVWEGADSQLDSGELSHLRSAFSGTIPNETQIFFQRNIGDTDAFLGTTEFFIKLGMFALPERDASGTFLGGSLVWASARDFAKFGYLYLRDGTWEGERLLPEGWVDFARTKTPADNANIYGAGWWITAYGETRTHAQNAKTPPWDAFHAGGHEGQTIWVVPSRDLVIVRLGLMTNAPENWEALYEWNQKIARAFPEVILSE
jgi:CubicO group peptidase (beta-lactamase class C family)